MEHSELLKEQQILNRLSSLPKNVLSLHGTENVAEFVLHDLCSKNCFDFQKAAYLVDNPDFDCLKGIAGYASDQEYNKPMIWETPELFAQHMSRASFNQKVRGIHRASMAKASKTDQETTAIVADMLGLAKPLFCSWRMKHDNHGILIYEANCCPVSSDILLNGACMLGFCPIY